MGTDDKRSFLESRKSKLAQMEIGLKAGKLATDKEDYDALTWGRVLELSQELERLDAASSPKTTAQIAKELAFIARTNIALAFRFNTMQPKAEAGSQPIPVESTQQPQQPQQQPADSATVSDWDITDLDEID
jgi:hypothetical protein